MILKFKQLDASIIVVLFFFMFMGTAVIYSATVGTELDGIYRNFLVIFAFLMVVILFAAMINYHLWIHTLSWYLYALGIALLLFVKFKGVEIHGSRRWIDLHFIQFQPSEVMKIFLILVLARMLHKRKAGHLRFWRDVVPMGLVTFLPFYLVYDQPDMGTSIVFLSILAGMLWIGNVRKFHVLLGILIAAALVVGLFGLYRYHFDLFSTIIHPHQLDRIQTFLGANPDAGDSWHVHNSIVAIGTGGLTGEGFLNGYYTHNGFIPFDYADSIFVVIGEEFGFLGASVLLLLYFVLIYRMVQIALRSGDRAGTFMIVGICSMLTLQIFENIAMHTGLMPLTGIALPFISYGGSSLLMNMISMGFVLSVKLHTAPQPSGGA